MSSLVAVILAAGNGRRMRPLTHFVPKPMLPVGNRPLIELHVEMLKACGAERVVVVVGHLGDQIEQSLGSGEHLDVAIEYVRQPSPEGIAQALSMAGDHVQDAMIVSLGDIYFLADDLRPAVAPVLSGEADAVLLSKHARARDEIKMNFEILASASGRVSRVVEKPADPVGNIKGCGLYVFNPKIFDAIIRTPRSVLRNEFELTDAIQTLINDGADVRHAPLIHADINLTSPADLLAANLAELDRCDRPHLLGNHVRLHARAHITNSVVGHDVRIEQPIRVDRSVILADTVVRESKDIFSAVVGPAGIVTC
jgi:dTDP-glucose pyrophosphorylase